ncbi:hypothetical protein ACJX0J_015267 [Zea mays]
MSCTPYASSHYCKKLRTGNKRTLNLAGRQQVYTETAGYIRMLGFKIKQQKQLFVFFVFVQLYRNYLLPQKIAKTTIPRWYIALKKMWNPLDRVEPAHISTQLSVFFMFSLNLYKHIISCSLISGT